MENTNFEGWHQAIYTLIHNQVVYVNDTNAATLITLQEYLYYT